MITPPTSSEYRPSLSHSSSTWQPAPAAAAPPAATVHPPPPPPPREPETAAGGAPPSVFRQNPNFAAAPSATFSPSPSPAAATAAASQSHAASAQFPLPSSSTPYEQQHTPTRSDGGASGSSTSASSPLAEPQPAAARGKRSLEESTPPIRLENLSHVVELAKNDYARGALGYEDSRRYEISSMPVADVIEMVAGLLTKITSQNDRTHSDLHRALPADAAAAGGAAGMGATTSSVLAFHGKNVPSITILSYLSRIHKYCPTTYEVFLSLLVYFDRMTERVNKRDASHYHNQTRADVSLGEDSPASPLSPVSTEVPHHVFVVDSFNIHRLVIAGVTCASKFFSDVFYTNSRYAKVGGLPLAELNHLELQFLVLNDFRLSVPVEELESYGTMLVQFYAREAIANANLAPVVTPPTAVPGSQHEHHPHQQQQQQQQYVEVGGGGGGQSARA